MLAAGYGIVVGAALAAGWRPVYSLLLTTLLMTRFFALLGWHTFAVQTDYGALVATGAPAALVTQPLRYPAHAPVTLLLPRFDAAGLELLPLASGADAVWALPLHARQGQIGVLLLGRRRGYGLYTEEEIAIARAAGERLLDLQVTAALARRLLDLTRAQGAESQVADRQMRRVLHDEILPDLRAALILLDQGDGVATAEAGQLLATVPPRRHRPHRRAQRRSDLLCRARAGA